MAKRRLGTGYTFTAASKTITHADFSDITLAGIQLIVNVTDQIIIYNFADTTKGGTLATDTLTLEYDTTTMSDTDELMILVEDGVASQPISASSLPLPTGASTSAKQDTIIGHLDGVEGLLTTIDADTGNISTKIDTIAGAVSGTEVQVDVLTMPTTTVQATNLDIRDLTNASDSVTIYGSDDGGTTKRVIKTDAGGAIQVDLEVANVAITSIAAGDNNIGNVDIVSSALPTGASTSANQTTIIGHLDGVEGLLTTIDADTGSILTSVQLLDDAVQVLGTDTYTEASSKGITLGAVRRDADTTLVNTTNEFTPLQVDANGRLKVEVFSGETLPVSLTSTTITGTVAVTQSGTWDEVGINDSGNSITIDNSTLAVVGGGTEATAMRVTIASDSTGVLSVDDNGGSLTVDGTITANLSATDNAVLDNIDLATTSKYITGIGHGVKTVTTAGTDEALAGSTACKKVVIQAMNNNTGVIAIGGSGVDATLNTGTGVILYAGDVFELDIDNLADVFIDSTVSGEKVRYTYFT